MKKLKLGIIRVKEESKEISRELAKQQYINCSVCGEVVELREWKDHMYAHRLQLELNPTSTIQAPANITEDLHNIETLSGSEREVTMIILCTACKKTFLQDEYRDHAIAHRLERQLQIMDSTPQSERPRNNSQISEYSRHNTRIGVNSLPKIHRTMRLPPNLDNYLETQQQRDIRYYEDSTLQTTFNSQIEERKTRSKSRSRNKAKEPVEENCTICLDLMKKGQQLKFLPCMHKFHEKCIGVWLRSNRICPLCRQG